MKPLIKNHIQTLRQSPTDAEKHLWYFLRAKRLQGYKFRRQHLIHPFIVDFICLEKKLIVELDGGQHAERERYDSRRTAYLKTKGYDVLRFWNHDVLQSMEEVLGEIFRGLEKG